jgi:predicted  nucleic acid-binding Zn-ribbon protein
MDNEQLIDRVQTLLLGMEERTNVRLDKMDFRLGSLEARLGSVETKLDSVHRELTLNNELLAPFIRWSHSIENEIIRLSAQLQEVQARLAKLENPQTQ